MLIGHEQQVGWLERELPQVTLLTGPLSVGKRRLAEFVLSRHGGVDLAIEKLTADSARQVETEARVAPLTRGRKNIIIELDGSTEQAQNILLKTLEEPPLTVRFMLIASRPPLRTIVSRCAVIKLGLLTDDQVAEVLKLHGASGDEAARYASSGYGCAAPALTAYRDHETTKVVSGVVGAALKAAMDLSAPGLLGQAMRNWEFEHTTFLYRWATEAASGRWRVFDADFAPGATRDQARSLLAAMSYYSGSRQCARVALDSVFGRS